MSPANALSPSSPPHMNFVVERWRTHKKTAPSAVLGTVSVVWPVLGLSINHIKIVVGKAGPFVIWPADKYRTQDGTEKKLYYIWFERQKQREIDNQIIETLLARGEISLSQPTIGEPLLTEPVQGMGRSKAHDNTTYWDRPPPDEFNF